MGIEDLVALRINRSLKSASPHRVIETLLSGSFPAIRDNAPTILGSLKSVMSPVRVSGTPRSVSPVGQDNLRTISSRRSLQRAMCSTHITEAPQSVFKTGWDWGKEL